MCSGDGSSNRHGLYLIPIRRKEYIYEGNSQFAFALVTMDSSIVKDWLTARLYSVPILKNYRGSVENVSQLLDVSILIRIVLFVKLL